MACLSFDQVFELKLHLKYFLAVEVLIKVIARKDERPSGVLFFAKTIDVRRPVIEMMKPEFDLSAARNNCLSRYSSPLLS
jgi:hypothetical protein